MAIAEPLAPGQRWMSEAEPELGLGLVVDVDRRSVALAFATAEETRRYAVRTAPLRRVRFGPGETVHTRDGSPLLIEAVDERDGLLVYRGGEREVPEAELSDRIALGDSRERLLARRVDSPTLFDLRLAVLRHLHRTRRSPVRGFVGPRLELVAHQFYIAAEVTRRHAPRVLLADETGLGKTIEACLILNRLLVAGRAARVLILVPDALVHQWLVELRRRFNLPFAVFDPERCAAIVESDPGANPFLSEQLVLAGLALLTDSEARTREAAAAGWDVIVVDEAHHLAWTRAGASRAYDAVARVAARADGLLLLSATPERLGEEGHFARLRLLDPSRYDDFERWQHESQGFREIARLGQRLLDTTDGDRAADGAAPRHMGREPSGQRAGPAPALAPDDVARLARALGTTTSEITPRIAEPTGRRRLLDELIDRHGPGRVMFRNTRAAMPTFPERRVVLHRLAPSSGSATTGAAGTPDPPALDGDPRIDYLLTLLAAPEPAKLLVLCDSAATTHAIKAAVERRRKVRIALFHEDMTLLQRDRSAAWFAEPSGARVLVASEIGSEGRNFQHAQVMVMFDLPLDPDLVEQRIGRLDRIGQRGTVHIHVPFVADSGQEVLARWHHEGVDTFTRPTLTALPLLERFGDRVRDLAVRADAAAGKPSRQHAGAAARPGARGRADATAGKPPRASARGATRDRVAEEIDALIAETARGARELAREVEEGRDRLLELASLRRGVADALLTEIAELDRDPEIEDLSLRVLEHFHVYAEEVGPRCYLLNPDGIESEEFPTLSQGETTITFDRQTALVREDLTFVTSEHPLLLDAVELLLASEAGNACFAVAADDGPPRLRLESVLVLETVAPPRLHVDRFLPPTPVLAATDQTPTDHAAALAAGAARAFAPGRGVSIATYRAALAPLLATMSTRCTELAEARAATLRAAAVAELRDVLGGELRRLRVLAAVNDHIRPAEITALARELAELEGYIAAARLRPDALRLVWCGPPDAQTGGTA